MRTLFTTHTQQLAIDARLAPRQAASQPRAPMASYRGSVAGYRAAYAVANAVANEASAQEHLP